MEQKGLTDSGTLIKERSAGTTLGQLTYIRVVEIQLPLKMPLS